MNKKEKKLLNSIAANSLYTTFSNTMMIEYCFEVFKRYLKKGSILELGPAEGIMSVLLGRQTEHLVLVDGSDIFCNQLQEKLPDATIINCLFEEFLPEEKFDNIVLGHVLEHVENPVSLLQLVKNWLKEDGIILTAVPNSRSLHRQAAVILGLQAQEDSMSELDIHHGHRRVYNPESFRADFRKAGLSIVSYGGYWMKPISNKQIHESWTPEMLWAFMQLGERYPDIAAEIFVIANNRNK